MYSYCSASKVGGWHRGYLYFKWKKGVLSTSTQMISPNTKYFCSIHFYWCVLYIVHCTLYIVHCTLYIVHCTLYTVHCTLYIVQYIVHCTLYIDYLSLKNSSHQRLFMNSLQFSSLRVLWKTVRIMKRTGLHRI